MDKSFFQRAFHWFSLCKNWLKNKFPRFEGSYGPVFFSGPSMPDPMLDLFKTAWAVYAEDHSYQAAASIAEIVLASNDGNYPVFVLMRAHLLLALCSMEAGDTAAADSQITEGLALCTTEPSLMSERLMLLCAQVNLRFKQNRRDSAWAIIKQTLNVAESSPFNDDDEFRQHVLAPNYYNLAIISFEHEFYREAARCYALALEIWQILPAEEDYVQRAQSGLQAAHVMMLEETLSGTL